MTNLMHNYVVLNIYYYNPLHVSSNTVLIIRRSNCINTASCIVVSVSVQVKKELKLLLNLHTGRSLILDAVLTLILLTWRIW